MQDMTPQEHQWADVHEEQRDSRRCTKTGKAFQNYRRVLLHILRGMVKKKRYFMIWRSLVPKWSHAFKMEDLIWTEDDMENFLNTKASLETHKHLWRERVENRRNPKHKEFGKPMPKMIPPSYVRLFQITLSQTHSSKFKEHFGAASIDGTLHTPFQLMAGSDDQVAGSAAIATRFQVRLFNEDTRMAIDSKTSFLDSDAAMELVTQVRNYKGTKLWLFMMDRVQKMAAEERGSYVSPFQVRLGYEQILGTAFKTHWLHKQDFKESIEDLTVCGGSKRPRATAATAVSRPEKQQKTKVPLWKKQQQQQEQQQRPPAPSTR